MCGNIGDYSVMRNTCKSNLEAPLAAEGRMWAGIYACSVYLPEHVSLIVLQVEKSQLTVSVHKEQSTRIHGEISCSVSTQLQKNTNASLEEKVVDFQINSYLCFSGISNYRCPHFNYTIFFLQ